MSIDSKHVTLSAADFPRGAWRWLFQIPERGEATWMRLSASYSPRHHHRPPVILGRLHEGRERLAHAVQERHGLRIRWMPRLVYVAEEDPAFRLQRS